MTPDYPCKKCGAISWKKNGKGWRCRPCQNALVTAYRKRNPEKVKAAARERENSKYQNDPAHRERAKANAKRWSAANKERRKKNLQKYQKEHNNQRRAYMKKWLSANKDRVNELQRKYYRERPELREAVRFKTQTRRARKNASGEIALTQQEWLDVLLIWEHSCAYCGKPANKLHADHVVPLARGGPHIVSNVVPACQTCNLSKGCRTPEEWRANLNSRDCAQARTDAGTRGVPSLESACPVGIR